MRIDGARVVDARNVDASPGSVLVRFEGEVSEVEGRLEGRGFVVAAGESAEVARHPLNAGARVVDRRGCLLIPGLVNAHTHLDLTHIGPMPHDPDGGFRGFVDAVRRGRRVDDEGIAASMREGAAMSLAGGVVAVGDIAGAPMGRPSLAAWRALREVFSVGVSFLEFFAIGRGMEPARERLATLVRENRGEIERLGGMGVRLGVQPHAPTTVDRRVYEWVLSSHEFQGWPVSTHLAETMDEREFVARGTGPQREFLEGLGLWSDEILEEVGRGDSPVQHLAGALGRRRFVCAHLNDVSDADIEVLARMGTSVAYCPRASEYFGAERVFGPHRYRDMMAAGVNVCLGTDSVINLPAGTSRVSTWGEVVRLVERDGLTLREGLAMCTVNGARALGIDEGMFGFAPGGGGFGGLVAVGDEGGTELVYRWR
ncbi:MAG TPA: amidohydrolase family protein [Phycisphaerales bacterium]|nr:amidohydrolase family protein [Phycisphaerales bacterium]